MQRVPMGIIGKMGHFGEPDTDGSFFMMRFYLYAVHLPSDFRRRFEHHHAVTVVTLTDNASQTREKDSFVFRSEVTDIAEGYEGPWE